MMDEKTTEEIRELFGITNDFTPEEEEANISSMILSAHQNQNLWRIHMAISGTSQSLNLCRMKMMTKKNKNKKQTHKMNVSNEKLSYLR
jgi:hypothetical protein